MDIKIWPTLFFLIFIARDAGFAAESSVAPVCKFRIEISAYNGATTVQNQALPNMDSEEKCQRAIQAHCLKKNPNQVRDFVIKWDYGTESDVAKWSKFECKF